MANLENQNASSNPRLNLLRQEVEQTVMKPFRSHGWSANIDREIDAEDCIEITANKGPVTTRIAVLYSSGISNAQFRELSTRVEHIFFNGQPYLLDSFASGVTVPVEPLGDFFSFLVSLNKIMEPDRSPSVKTHKKVKVRRLTAENPLETVITRLQQFTSKKLATKLVKRRASEEGISILPETINNKATGIAYSMRSALDYFMFTSNEKLNRRVLSLYYGTMALAQVEMLASPSGPIDLEQVEGMTKQGHGLYTFANPCSGFSDFIVGVRATGFLPKWMDFLGHDTSNYPRRRTQTQKELDKISDSMVCSLRDLYASMPEIEDLFAEVFGGPPSWISVAYDRESNSRRHMLNATTKKADSTYALFIDGSGEISVESLLGAGWPLAEIQKAEDYTGTGIAFRARVDHADHDSLWEVLPTHTSPFGKSHTLLFPTMGGLREYRTIAAVTLYALSIMVRYMPSAWRRIEGGDEDQYLALVNASLAVWERLLPELFLESIAGERIVTAQPGSLLS